VGYYGSKLGGLTGDPAGFQNDNLGKACEDAVALLVEFLAEQLESIPWEVAVVPVKHAQVVINRGSREGVSEGMTFEVGEIEELVDPDTGEVLDVEPTRAGTNQITPVKEKAACKPLFSQRSPRLSTDGTRSSR